MVNTTWISFPGVLKIKFYTNQHDLFICFIISGFFLFSLSLIIIQLQLLARQEFKPSNFWLKVRHDYDYLMLEIDIVGNLIIQLQLTLYFIYRNQNVFLLSVMYHTRSSVSYIYKTFFNNKIDNKQCKNLRRAIQPLVSTVLIALCAQIPKMTLKTFFGMLIFDLSLL